MKRVFEGGLKRLTWFFAYPQRPGHPRADERGAGHIGQADQPRAVGETVRDITAEPQREPGLADSASAAQRQQTDVSEQQR